MTNIQKPSAPVYASTTSGYYPVVMAVFVSLLVISNIGAVKLISFGPLILDGGAFLFPLVYITGDILSEVYGFKAARKAILVGFAMAILAAVTFWLVQLSPPGGGWANQDAYEAILGFVPRIVFASVCGFLVGQLLNSYVLVKIKARTGRRPCAFLSVGAWLSFSSSGKVKPAVLPVPVWAPARISPPFNTAGIACN